MSYSLARGWGVQCFSDKVINQKSHIKASTDRHFIVSLSNVLNPSFTNYNTECLHTITNTDLAIS